MNVPADLTAEHQRTDLLRFVEQLGLLFAEAGMARMPARVFAFALADDAESYTAGELAAHLQVSPAAISGAVRSLVQSGLLARDRTPGQRVDHYRVYDTDVWAAIMDQQSAALARQDAHLVKEMSRLDSGGPGYRRVLETLEYYRFIRALLPELAERWHEHRDQLRRRWDAGED